MRLTSLDLSLVLYQYSVQLLKETERNQLNKKSRVVRHPNMVALALKSYCRAFFFLRSKDKAADSVNGLFIYIQAKSPFADLSFDSQVLSSYI